MPINILDFFSPDRLFHIRPSISMNSIYFLFTVFSLLILLAIVFGVLKKKKDKDVLITKLYQKYFVMFLTIGISGMFLLLFRYERVTILSARFWLVIWGVVLAVWLGFVLVYQYKKIPELKKQKQKQDEFRKYLPSNHKNKKNKKH